MTRTGLLLFVCAIQTFSAQDIDILETTSAVPMWNVRVLRSASHNQEYGSNNIQYGSYNVQYGSNNIQYGDNNLQKGQHNIQYGSYNLQDGLHNIQYGSSNVQLGTFNIQYGMHKYQDGDHKIQNADSRKRSIAQSGYVIIPTIPVGEDIYFSKGLKDRYNDTEYFRVMSNDRTTAEDNVQGKLVITLSSSHPVHSGDTLMIRPRNCQEHVDDLFRMFNKHGLGMQPEYKLLVQEMHPDMPVPEVLRTPVTVHRIAEQYWDLKAYATPNVFALLARISEDKMEKDRCIELSSTEGKTELSNYSQKTILEVLDDFPKTASKLTVPILFELFSTITPQSFSIADSNLIERNSLDIIVPVVENGTQVQVAGKGLCTNWMANLRYEDRIYGYVKQA